MNYVSFLISTADRPARGGSLEFIPYGARQPGDARWCSLVDEAASRLLERLSGLDTGLLPVSEYNRRYLSGYIGKLPYSLQKEAYVLALALSAGGTAPGETVLVDYGGGSGTMSMLAREAGIGTVVYTDIYDVSCEDASVIAEGLGLAADHYVTGEIDDVEEFLRSEGLDCNALVSMNVIEHIYDIEHFLTSVPRLGSGRMSAALYTSANGANPARRIQLTRDHRVAERRGKKKEWGHKERDCLEPYLEVRRGMVEERLTETGTTPGAATVDTLVRYSRGMRADDISSCVDAFVDSGRLPARPLHPTNTCDPHTGNWKERIMDPWSLAGTLRDTGLDADVLPGYYSSGPPVVRAVGRALNLAVGVLRPRPALALAPSYILLASRPAAHQEQYK
jgi:hypothetical protein